MDESPGLPTSAAEWARRAQAAADSVNVGYGHRLLGFVPGTWLARTARPAPAGGGPWHYWWQAHYLDCLVDAAWRRLGDPASQGRDPAMLGGDPATLGGDPASQGRDPAMLGGDPATLALAPRLLRTIRLRNAFRFENDYYDDMAWLALAAGRAEALIQRLRRRGLRGARTAARVLGRQLASADTAELGGGLFWNTRRDFKNAPATAPAALFFARTGKRERAQRLVDWLGARLFDPDLGLYLDGLRIGPGDTAELVTDVWTYNQGPVLGALLELGGEANLARAEALIAAVGRGLTTEVGIPGEHGGAATGGAEVPGGVVRALQANGDGDGGLFMGILARYLTAAAVHGRLPATARAEASRLVVDTAEALWAGAEERRDGTGRQLLTFPMHPGQPASTAYPPSARVELSTQLQAWMVIEFAHQLTRAPGEAEKEAEK
ncbi:glycoside hydrolase family 76 protein [Sinomonas mesophila]|uniref:glycoside hydrolase family 76 protein n=1 Tax=Sinomonas mesophila TaxID=1531955 RepID=UPI0009869C9D|nr:glycoside hydrolase family 76 protein [Sinomonas mesophila]